MCAQALDSTITTIAPWRDAEFLERFKVSVFRRRGGEGRECVPIALATVGRLFVEFLAVTD